MMDKPCPQPTSHFYTDSGKQCEYCGETITHYYSDGKQENSFIDFSDRILIDSGGQKLEYEHEQPSVTIPCKPNVTEELDKLIRVNNIVWPILFGLSLLGILCQIVGLIERFK